MMALNGLKIDPQTARAVVKSCRTTSAWRPEEARPAAYEVERRFSTTKPLRDRRREGRLQCRATRWAASSRSGARKQEWDLLIAMHRGWYPLDRPPGVPPHGPGAARSRRRRPPARHASPVGEGRRLPGRDLPAADDGVVVVGRVDAPGAHRRHVDAHGLGDRQGPDLRPGRDHAGRRHAPTSSPPTTTYTYARSGEQVTRTGRTSIYTGFQWRGRSTVGGADGTALREVMFVERDWRGIDGRWFTGGYDELGIDVQLAPRRHETDRARRRSQPACRAGGTGQALKIYVANAAGVARAARPRLRPGRHGRGGARVAGDVITATVDVRGRRRHRPARPGRRRHGRSRGAGHGLRQGRLDPGDARRGTWRASAASCSRRCSRSFDAWALQQRPRQEARHRRRPQARRRGRDVERRGIHGDLRRRRHQVRRAASTPPRACSRRTSTARTRSARASATTWATSGWWPATRRRRSTTPLKGRAHLLVTVPLYMKFDPTVTP